MTSDSWGLDVPSSWAEIPRRVPGIDRVNRYLLRPEPTPPLGEGWLVPGEFYDG